MVDKLLNYWLSLEIFQPCWPIKEKSEEKDKYKKEIVDLRKEIIAWPVTSGNNDEEIYYDIYIGKVISDDIICWMIDSLDESSEDIVIEKDYSKCCVCAFKVDKNGEYVPHSFAISGFVWALIELVKRKDYMAPLLLAELKKAEEEILSLLCKQEVFNDKIFRSIFSIVHKELGLKPVKTEATIWAKKVIIKRRKDGKFPDVNPATELVASFFINDIERIMKAPGEQIKQYIEGIGKSDFKSVRKLIEEDIIQMKKWLLADCFPYGVWPSGYSPNLMQQIAINIAISGKEMFSVNGAPGTGKTTLLKEVVAANIVERAAVMSSYKDPDDAFHRYDFISPPNQLSLHYYMPDEQLIEYGMLVASNNNNAVENITKELPKVITKDRTGCFTNNRNGGEDYFSDLATSLLGEDAWGLISAPMGKKDIMEPLKNILLFSKGPTLIKYCNKKIGSIPDWETARVNFNRAWDNVQQYRNSISVAQQQISNVDSMIAEKENAVAVYEQSKQLYERRLKDVELLKKGLEDLEKQYQLYLQNTLDLKTRTKWYQRVFNSKASIVIEWKRNEQLADETLIQIAQQRARITEADDLCKKAEIDKQDRNRVVEECDSKMIGLIQEIEVYKEQFSDNLAHHDFWRGIENNKKSHAACPWTNKKYDALREELFYQSLMLHKAFVLKSNSVKQNIIRLINVWNGAFTNEDEINSYGSLLNTLFFVIPVLSITFASVGKVLANIQQESLGFLIIDEAGQATPQSALGAIWRCKKTIVVGDPLQVEPIMKAPRELVKRFAKGYDVPTVYRIPELSVQMLADARNMYGGYRILQDTKIWVGSPLACHRRCIEPMFSISNDVAYNGRMFYMTQPPSDKEVFLLNESCWFDIKGSENGNKDHTVRQQAAWVERFLENGIRELGELPDIYIITPFTTVKNSLKKSAEKVINKVLPGLDDPEKDHWLDNNIGTIHTFQGKEANEVLLVLGCDSISGRGAAAWVGQKPNIINVAVSRAKYRIGVIGDYDLWKSVPHVSLVCNKLPVKQGT